MRDLAAKLRVGGIGTAVIAFALGALHALTPVTATRTSPRLLFGAGDLCASPCRCRCCMSCGLRRLFVSFCRRPTAIIHGAGFARFTAVGFGLIVLAGAIMQSLGSGSSARLSPSSTIATARSRKSFE